MPDDELHGLHLEHAPRRRPGLHAELQDYSRAAQIGRLLAGTRSSIDLVSLCEVWDEDLLHGGDDASGIRPLSGYAHAIHGSRVDQQSEGCVIPLPPFVAPTPTAANSALGMMSDLRLDDAVQISFHDCSGSCPTDTSPHCLPARASSRPRS